MSSLEHFELNISLQKQILFELKKRPMTLLELKSKLGFRTNECLTCLREMVKNRLIMRVDNHYNFYRLIRNYKSRK